jgi:flavin-dependent dehydrogenase
VSADLLIAGAGPVGLAVAIEARLRGLGAVVVERRRPPLDKACGEGLMPLGVAQLASLGVAIDPARSANFAGIRFVDDHSTAEGRFADGLGLGVRRTALSESLLARAREVGVELRFGESVTSWSTRGDAGVLVTTSRGTSEARLLVGADGLHSAIRRMAGLEGAQRGRVRNGMRRHFRVSNAGPFVEVHWALGAEAYVTPVGRDEIGVALLWSGEPARYDALLARFPRLAARVAGAEPTSRVEGASRFRRAVRRRHAPGVALVGDAAGYLDPLTGEGLTLGFRCARALVDTVARGAPLADYERAYRSLSRSYYQMTSLLLAVAARPWLRRRVVRALARRPDLFDHLLAINAGQSPLRALGASGALRLVGGLVG